MAFTGLQRHLDCASGLTTKLSEVRFPALQDDHPCSPRGVRMGRKTNRSPNFDAVDFPSPYPTEDEV